MQAIGLTALGYSGPEPPVTRKAGTVFETARCRVMLLISAVCLLGLTVIDVMVLMLSAMYVNS